MQRHVRRKFDSSMLKWLRGTHAIPSFSGDQSRSHQRRPLRELKARAWRSSLGDRRFSEVECFVQFAGFPRSGHSIVGSILDAHEHCVVSHELDAMGLVAADFSLSEIAALIRENSSDFTRNDRFWNGFCYKVDGGMHGTASRMRVIGDKKGDWATRRCAQQPALLERLRRRAGKKAVKWIFVVRNPFDNIATMSMRKGALYDRLRIQSSNAEHFRTRLSERRGTEIASSIRTDMVEDYAGLCQGVATMKRREPANDWLEIRHEQFIAQPREVLQRIIEFLGLDDTENFVERAARIVSPHPHRSRFELDWPPALSSRVIELINQHDFLSNYSFDD